jgi:hypothetical protein
MASVALLKLRGKITSEIDSLYSPIDSPGMGRIAQADVPRYWELQNEYRAIQDWIEGEDTLPPTPECLQ